MHPPSAAELLDAWERGRTASPLDRPLLLLAAAMPDAPAERLAALPIGERNARLLRLRAGIFGGRAEGTAECPACAVRVEFALEVAALLAAAPPGADPPEPPPWFDLDRGGGRFRLPTTADLRAVTAPGAGGAAALARRCVDAGAGGTPISARVMDAAVAAMEAADPLADPEISLRCPGCDARWGAPLDVAAFVWTEVDAWARRLLREVHRIARAYGWTEGEILALTPQRRALYLELIDA